MHSPRAAPGSCAELSLAGPSCDELQSGPWFLPNPPPHHAQVPLPCEHSYLTIPLHKSVLSGAGSQSSSGREAPSNRAVRCGQDGPESSVITALGTVPSPGKCKSRKRWLQQGCRHFPLSAGGMAGLPPREGSADLTHVTEPPGNGPRGDGGSSQV